MGKGKQGQLLHRRECETVTKEEAAAYLRGLGYDAIEKEVTGSTRAGSQITTAKMFIAVPGVEIASSKRNRTISVNIADQIIEEDDRE